MHLRTVVVAWLLFITLLLDGMKAENNTVDERCDIQKSFNVTPTSKLVKLEKSYYRIDGKEVYINEEPLSLWLKVNPQNMFSLKSSRAWNNRRTVKIFFEPYGNERCLKSFDASVSLKINFLNCECQPFEQNNETFVPFKVWTENGLVAFEVSRYSTHLNFYVSEEEEGKLNTLICLNFDFLESNYYGYDYTDLIMFVSEINENNGTELFEEINQNVTFFTDNGTDYINLVNPITVVWLKIKDSAPEHFLLIETESGEIMQKSFE
uniref:Uncharacterized protein n=1 Tax=Panagrolaimus superbus TaxID=310955 RepID=A0A914XZY1_9BILA